MSIRIRMSGPDSQQELASLYAWLGNDSAIRQHADISLVISQPRPSDMGAAFEVIQLMTDSGFQAANLVLAYAGWRATRSRRPRVTIEINDARSFVLDDYDPNIAS
jgi:Effector Associated Constant Component 1